MKVVLAFSGGLDTSVILHLLQERMGAEVITVTVDVGQKEDFNFIKEKAYALGALKHYYIDAKQEFVEKYVAPAIKANALYEGAYPHSTALARPLIVEKVVEVALKEGTHYIAHGCTGKGNDQVRFDVAVKALYPEAEIIAPVREWGLTRDWELKYASEHGIPVSHGIYSIDENLWGRSIEGGVLEDPYAEPPEEVFEWTTAPELAPDTPEYLSIEFEEGIPVAVNGVKLPLMSIISLLNAMAGKHGVGRIDHMEDRTVGIKSREVYEAPAAITLIKAHKDLEKLVLTKWELMFKELADNTWSWLVYNGLWFEPLREELTELINLMNKGVEGEVKLKLFKGTATVVSRASPYALYDLKLSSYESISSFDQSLGKGFTQLWGLQSTVAAALRRKVKAEAVALTCTGGSS